MTELSDETLVNLARGGDPTAFAGLVERHYDMVYRVGYKWLGSVADAEDLAQDVAIKLATALKTFEGRSAFTSWLYRLTLNMVHDRQRSTKRTTDHLAALAHTTPGSAGPEAEQRLEQADLWNAVHALPERQRDAMLLVYSEELTHREAADVLGCAEGTIASNISDAKKALRETLNATSELAG